MKKSKTECHEIQFLSPHPFLIQQCHMSVCSFYAVHNVPLKVTNFYKLLQVPVGEGLALSPLREKEEIGNTASYPPSSVTHNESISKCVCVCEGSEGAGAGRQGALLIAQHSWLNSSVWG